MPANSDSPPFSPRSAKLFQPWWAAVFGCLAIAAALRVWGAASNSGHGNLYYSATALSMSKDWSTFFTGGLDTEHFISMDKPAVWLWPSALLIKVFGLHWATLFLPNALAGVASVLVLALAVREGGGDGRAGRAAALAAALALAVSPMNVAIDRDNNPDALMLLALLLAAWMALRAVRRGRTLPLLGAGALAGLAFEAKWVEAYIVVPALALAWLVAGAGPVARRLVRLGAAGAVLAAVSAIWPVLFSLIPSGRRPWVNSSTDGSVLSRLTAIARIHLDPPARGQDEAARLSRAFDTGEVFHSGTAGAGRLFSGVLADQSSWWLPLAVLGAATAAYGLRGRDRTDPARAALVLWSGWALCAWGVFSFMDGVLHPYYTSLLVPAAVALSATGLVMAWTSWRRGEAFGTAALAAHVLVAAGWSASVLWRTSAQRPGWLAPLVVAAGALALAAVALARLRPSGTAVLGAAAAGLTAVAALAAPLAWSARTADQRLLGVNPLANQSGRYLPAVAPPQFGRGFLNQLRGTGRADPALMAHLERNRGDARWIAAAFQALETAPLILASGGEPALAVGGFDGFDPTPKLPQFQRLVRAGDVRFMLAPPLEGIGYIDGPAVQVTKWALRTCRPVDLTGGAGPGGPKAPPFNPVTGLILLDCKGAS